MFRVTDFTDIKKRPVDDRAFRHLQAVTVQYLLPTLSFFKNNLPIKTIVGRLLQEQTLLISHILLLINLGSIIATTLGYAGSIVVRALNNICVIAKSGLINI